MSQAHGIRIFALTLATFFAATPALAEKPDWAGSGKDAKREHKEKNPGRDDKHRKHDPRHEGQPGGGAIEFRFGDDYRHIVNDYYAPRFRAGKCPPGLAKKKNGCLPPGQAKKWRRGYALPHDLRYYDLPQDLTIRLPMPPNGHRYVRIASDILLIAIGTGMVIDALEDIGRF